VIQGSAVTLKPTAPHLEVGPLNANLWSEGVTSELTEASRLLLACWAAVCSWDPGFVATEAWEQVPRVAGEGNEIQRLLHVLFLSGGKEPWLL